MPGPLFWCDCGPVQRADFLQPLQGMNTSVVPILHRLIRSRDRTTTASGQGEGDQEEGAQQAVVHPAREGLASLTNLANSVVSSVMTVVIRSLTEQTHTRFHLADVYTIHFLDPVKYHIVMKILTETEVPPFYFARLPASL